MCPKRVPDLAGTLQAERQRLAQIPGMTNPHDALREEQMDD